MICFESRRQLLAQPRQQAGELREHIQSCRACARLSRDLAALDRQILKTTRITVPDGLADRIMLAGGYPSRLHVAAGLAAAALFLAIALVPILPAVLESAEPTLQGNAVGPGHPAVAAISMVIDREPALLKQPATFEPAAVQERLRFMGLALKEPGVSARYVGKCEVAGRECEHLVLVTPEGHASVFLMADEHPSTRVLIADRRMTALLSPAPAGAYIVVAESPKAVRRAQKLFVRG